MDPNSPGGLPPGDANRQDGGGNGNGRLIDLSIEDELKDSYLTYAMSVIVSRALPDVRDGLKPSQRRILVAMHDLNLSPTASRVKCAKISGDTSGNYHPHGEAVIYPTLVRMAQEWNMRYVLIDKQGNFGSIAGLPAAAMRYTEARMSPFAALMLEDLELDTVDFVPTYDEQRTEPTVLPSKFPNLLVNGAQGIAVGMATSIPPHNLGEICEAVVKLIDEPDVTIDELLEIVPGPDFPTGGMICGQEGIRRGYHTGRGSIILRARCQIEETSQGKRRIIVTEIPFQQVRDRVMERIGELVNEDKIKGISEVRDFSDLKHPVHIAIELKRDADPEVVLNQLYQFSPLQETVSIILLALVDGKPRILNIKELLEEFLRHRITVIRRRTQFLLNRARKRKHTVEGLLLAYANIDEMIAAIRTSATRVQAKERLLGIACPAAMMQRALGEAGYAVFQAERGVAGEYFLTPVQADAILNMTLGQLVNLEQEKLGEEFRKLLDEIAEYERLLGDESLIRALIRQDMLDVRRKHADERRTEISSEEVGVIDMEDLIAEETMVVTISHNGYIKRTPATAYRAQRRGGKGLKGADAEDEDPIEHLFVASTHAHLLFFTSLGKVYWLKVYDIPQGRRDSRGRAIVNLLRLAEGERIADCRAVREFGEDEYLLMATRGGLVKKTPLQAYARPLKGGMIAIKLREGDEVVGVAITRAGDEVVLSTAGGMAIRFNEANARPMGRNTSGVKGISLRAGDQVVGMVVADEAATLLTVCENGYGKRTPFGASTAGAADLADSGEGDEDDTAEQAPSSAADASGAAAVDGPRSTADESASHDGEEEADGGDESSARRYRTQRRGGKGVRDIKTTQRNGPVVGIVSVRDDDEVMMISKRGKIQRIRVSDISVIGRNTQGVRIMSLDEGDTLAAVVRVPRDESEGAAEEPREAARAESLAASEAAEDAPHEDERGDASAPNDAEA
jgi:DNA gyrase subunit A